MLIACRAACEPKLRAEVVVRYRPVGGAQGEVAQALQNGGISKRSR